MAATSSTILGATESDRLNFITETLGSSFFPSHVSVSPGLTVIANALRVGDRLIEQMK